MKSNRYLLEYVSAVILGSGVAALVFWQLESSDSTDCFRQSMEISIAEGRIALPGCDQTAFDAVREYVESQRGRLASDPDFVPEEPDEVKGKSALIVWMVLFAATAGFAGVISVLAWFMISDLKKEWGLARRNVAICGVCAAVPIALPFVYFRVVRFSLTSFEGLHGPQIAWMPALVGALTIPAATGLVVIWYILSSRKDLLLGDISRLGSRLRRLVSMLGGVVSIGVLATGSRWQAIATLPGGESLPSSAILLWGAAFAAVVAVLYIPVHRRWAMDAERLISLEVKRQRPSQGQPGSFGFRMPELSIKKELRATLGLGGALKTLQGAFAVLAPIVAAAISSQFS